MYCSSLDHVSWLSSQRFAQVVNDGHARGANDVRAGCADVRADVEVVSRIAIKGITKLTSRVPEDDR